MYSQGQMTVNILSHDYIQMMEIIIKVVIICCILDVTRLTACFSDVPTMHLKAV